MWPFRRMTRERRRTCTWSQPRRLRTRPADLEWSSVPSAPTWRRRLRRLAADERKKKDDSKNIWNLHHRQIYLLLLPLQWVPVSSLPQARGWQASGRGPCPRRKCIRPCLCWWLSRRRRRWSSPCLVPLGMEWPEGRQLNTITANRDS